MSLPDRAIVLIVGAGPSGLAAALSLLHHGFHDLVIVDALPQGINTSRSMLCQASALEALDTIGCRGEDIVSQGLKATSFDMHARSVKLCSLNTGCLRPYTRYPYFLIITQNVVERALERKLAASGVVIHRPLKVVGLARNTENPQLSNVTFEDGRIITVKYVIGADGARSTIRTISGIGFSDPTLPLGTEVEPAQMVFADVTFDHLNVDVNDTSPKTTISPNGAFAFFPLPRSFNESLAADVPISASERICRIGCSIPLTEGKIPRSQSKEYIQNLVDRFAPYHLSSNPTVNPNSKPTRIKHVVWSSRFLIRARIADTTFIRLGSGDSQDGGAVLLIGDAAHIHSPVGGQGINLGICDGILLGRALTKHIHATETKPLPHADAILDEFARNRGARALEVIKLTKSLTTLEEMKHRKRMYWWFPIDSQTFREWAFRVVGWIPFITRKMVWDLSGLSNVYV